MRMRMSARIAGYALVAAALWTAVALVVPSIATGNAVALVDIVAVGFVVAAFAGGSASQRRLPLGLIASAGTALLIYGAISWVLPTVPGFVSHNHPPTYTDVTRMVDPIAELAVFVLLAVAVCLDALRAWTRTRRAANGQGAPYVPGPNEMVVEPTA